MKFFGRFSKYKQQAQALAYVRGRDVIEMLYKRALKNFQALAIGISNKETVPSIVGKCKKFYKDNRKESQWNPKHCARLDEIFVRIEEGDFREADAAWIEGILLGHLRGRKEFAKAEFLKIVTRK